MRAVTPCLNIMSEACVTVTQSGKKALHLLINIRWRYNTTFVCRHPHELAHYYDYELNRLLNFLSFFRGMTTIDIALTKVDINQCNKGSGGQFQFEIFAGTHRCKNETTQVSYFLCVDLVKLLQNKCADVKLSKCIIMLVLILHEKRKSLFVRQFALYMSVERFIVCYCHFLEIFV